MPPVAALDGGKEQSRLQPALTLAEGEPRLAVQAEQLEGGLMYGRRGLALAIGVHCALQHGEQQRGARRREWGAQPRSHVAQDDAKLRAERRTACDGLGGLARRRQQRLAHQREARPHVRVATAHEGIEEGSHPCGQRAAQLEHGQRGQREQNRKQLAQPRLGGDGRTSAHGGHELGQAREVTACLVQCGPHRLLLLELALALRVLLRT